MRHKFQFTNGEFYHVFNRGLDKRIIFPEKIDLERFFQSMYEFNDIDAIGSIYQNSFRQHNLSPSGVNIKNKNKKRLVSFVCYCLNLNHYHFILQQLADRGIERFMQKLGSGFTRYFNDRYDREGALLQGPFKASHITSDEYFLHVSAYVNLNYEIHKLDARSIKSSWGEYVGNKHETAFCDKEIVLRQFRNKTDYKKFAEGTVANIRQRKSMEGVLLEDL